MTLSVAMVSKAAFIGAALLFGGLADSQAASRATTTRSSTTSARSSSKSSVSTSTTTVVFSAVYTSTAYACACIPTLSSRSTTTSPGTARTTNLSTTVTLGQSLASTAVVSSSTSASSRPQSSASASSVVSGASSSTGSASFSINTSTSGSVSSTTSAPTVIIPGGGTTTASTNTSTTLGTTASNNSTLVPTSVSRTSTATNSSASATATSVGGQTVSNTILILARNSVDAANAYAGLDGYGIPYQVLLVPQGGAALPTLNSSVTQGNYGGFIMVSELSYQTSSGGYASGLTDDQFNTIYAYQQFFGVRMVRLDTYPYTSAFGAGVVGECCDNASQEQLISFSNDTGFPGANIKLNAGMSTLGLYHYPSRITDPATTFEVAQFAPDSNAQFSGTTTAAVINNFNGRQQMVFFIAWGAQFSATSNFLQHGYIHWMTRGLFVGSRKSYFLTQVDDVHLRTGLYSPAGQFYRSVPDDYKIHADWTADLNSRLSAGSNYFVELAHNGNGDIIAATNGTNTNLCNPNTAIYYPAPADTDLEFQKSFGTGFTRWPTSPSNYTWSVACASIDALASWFMTPSNRDAFSHLSHTFTHLNQNNATFDDVNREIFFNQEWFRSIGLSSASRFSPNGLVPPAITGMHNGDAIRAWAQNGLTGVVGDNSRPVLRNTQSTYWPLISTVDSNGFDGMTIMPRWSNRVYYDCDTPACTTQEWTDRFSGTGSFTDLLELERSTTSRYLFGLRHDPYMFHQANLRAHDAPSFAVGSQNVNSLMQIWVETVLQEMTRTTNWPILTLKHDDMVTQFTQRMARDQCQPKLSWVYSQDGKSISGARVTANGNTCSAPIGVTFPGAASASSGARSDQVGSEPLIQWVNLQGSAVTFTLNSPISVL